MKLATQDPRLYRKLFEQPRIIPFSTCNWYRPTIAIRMGSLLCVHGGPLPEDETGLLFLSALQQEQPRMLRMKAGDVVVADNHRLLHGRTAFAGDERLILRILVWLREPLHVASPHRELAVAVHERLKLQVRNQPTWIQHRLGVFGEAGLDASCFPSDFQKVAPTPDAESADQRAQLVAALRNLDLSGSMASSTRSSGVGTI